MDKILISACLMGQKVRYDGKASTAPGDWISTWSREGRLIAVCPEVAGGLPVPRPAAEIQGGCGEDVLAGWARIETAEGVDVTESFIAGARHTLEIARRHRVTMAVLKARSPSCGSGVIYDGTFSNQKRPGLGVTAALLRQEGIQVYSEEQLEEAALQLDRPV